MRSATAGVAAAKQVLQQAQGGCCKPERIKKCETAPQQVSLVHSKAQAADAQVLQRKAQLEQAHLNLGYTIIRSPVTGIVGKKSVEVGENVSIGQELVDVVPLDDVWVTANFKETQLAHMRTGQPVEVHVDAYGRSWKGHVTNMGGGTALVFSLLPPENATGNCVKALSSECRFASISITLKDKISTPKAREAGTVRRAESESPMSAANAIPFDQAAGKANVNPWIIAIVASMAAFMEVLDTSIANVALPYIAGSLGATNDEGTWVLTSYLVSNAVVLPISGFLANRLGRKRFFYSVHHLLHNQLVLLRYRPEPWNVAFFRVLQGGFGGGACSR